MFIDQTTSGLFKNHATNVAAGAKNRIISVLAMAAQ
jgi:hypothetical protein